MLHLNFVKVEINVYIHLINTQLTNCLMMLYPSFAAENKDGEEPSLSRKSFTVCPQHSILRFSIKLIRSVIISLPSFPLY